MHRVVCCWSKPLGIQNEWKKNETIFGQGIMASFLFFYVIYLLWLRALVGHVPRLGHSVAFLIKSEKMTTTLLFSVEFVFVQLYSMWFATWSCFPEIKRKTLFLAFPQGEPFELIFKTTLRGFLARICCPKLGLYAVPRRKDCISLCLASV